MLKILYRGVEMKKSLTKLLGISLLAVAMTASILPIRVNATEITEESSSFIEAEKRSEAFEFQEPEDVQIDNLTLDKEQNNYPVVLVHGFLGWGRDEVAGFKYWGGTTDLQEKMRDSGYEVYTATVGPISSNWDRACELYAYIVGGTVDYGEAHSSKYGHDRYGRTYPGLYKKVSDANKIHLVGHSMGGQTVRTITQLLSEGSEE